MWLLLIYEVSTTTVKAMGRKASGYLRRWLRVPLSITSIGLYSNFTKIRIPVPSQGSKMPPGDDVMGLSRGQDCQSRDPEKKRKKVVSKNIRGPSRVILTRHHWNHKHWATRRWNVTFPAEFKSISSYGLG